MNKFLLPLGRVAGLVGFLLCLVSGLARLSGIYGMVGFEMLTFMQAGVAGMVFGSFCLLLVLTDGAGKN
jgi:hypothetical protein